MTEAELEAQDQIYFLQGLRLAVLAIENGRYAAVWQPRPYTQWWSHRRSLVDFKTEDDAYFNRGLRLGFIGLQENLTATYDPTRLTTPSNTPFPNGSLQNWGNAVRIRHSGGFTSWYFHLQSTGVLVNMRYLPLHDLLSKVCDITPKGRVCEYRQTAHRRQC